MGGPFSALHGRQDGAGWRWAWGVSCGGSGARRGALEQHNTPVTFKENTAHPLFRLVAGREGDWSEREVGRRPTQQPQFETTGQWAARPKTNPRL
jgi:hypothetical protein